VSAIEQLTKVTPGELNKLMDGVDDDQLFGAFGVGPRMFAAFGVGPRVSVPESGSGV
jgi:hypothetical protein